MCNLQYLPWADAKLIDHSLNGKIRLFISLKLIDQVKVDQPQIHSREASVFKLGGFVTSESNQLRHDLFFN